MSIKERYASAVNSSNLSVKYETNFSDTDCLAAMGIAARHHPLGAALQRLFVDGKARECVDLMAKMARDHSQLLQANLRKDSDTHRAGGTTVQNRSGKGRALSPFQSQRVAEKVLAWYRHGVCTECGGTGKEIIIEPKPHLSEDDCQHCRGTGRRLFEPNFTAETLAVACWLRDEVSKHQAYAGRAAMVAIGVNMDL
jgi:hypothetical protein